MSRAHDCVFCQILNGHRQQPFVYQDEWCSAFMDINQISPYHVLIVPNTHVVQVYDLSPEQSAAIFQASTRIARAVRAISDCDGLNLLSNNGRAAGQSVYHFHMHLLTRFSGDKIKAFSSLLLGRKHLPDEQVLSRMALNIKSKLQELEAGHG